jgi:NAD(P)-dependent dehydrogenase (short-subunit alcohol dehydrogenase family)
MRTVVVGASTGLGRCIGMGLARRGAQVALLARRHELLADAAKACLDALAITCDVTDEASCQAAVDRAAGELGGIDAVVYAAGIGVLSRNGGNSRATRRFLRVGSARSDGKRFPSADRGGLRLHRAVCVDLPVGEAVQDLVERHPPL